MAARIRNRLGETVTRNVVSLYGAYLVNYAVPLVTIPYLVRTLGPAAWGLVAMAQGFGNYLNLAVEYGFNLSATREVARHRHAPDRVADLVAGVMGAKLLLALGGVALAVLLQHAFPTLQKHPEILWAGVVAGIALGLNPLWYFQGCERMKVVAALEVITKSAAAAGVFFFIHSPADAWRVLGLQASASVLSTGFGLALTYRRVAARRPTAALVSSALRTGWTMFLFRNSAMLYTSGNSFLLGLFAPPTAVGYFAGAEKISKAFMGLLNPVNQALYPRLSHLAVHDPKEGGRLIRVNALLVGAGGLVLGGAVFLSAPLLVRILLGPALTPAIPILRLLAILPPLIGMNTVLMTQWMAPLGMDSILNRIICGAGLLNVGLAVILAPRYQQVGMACAVISAELFIGLAASLVLARRPGRRQELSAPSLCISDMEQSA
jgi:PST family polysaccharide transporter